MALEVDSSNIPRCIVLNSASKERKNNHSSSHKTHTGLSLSHPPYTYLHLSLISASSLSTSSLSGDDPQTFQNSPDLDALTIRTHLTAALSSFLGLTGSAIPIDILKYSGPVTSQNDVWIRVPTEDESAVITALGAWAGRGGREEGGMVGWRVKDTGSWLPGMIGTKDGAQALFHGL
ncbi:hypothetical protein EV356DRAFT_534909 [Viridothelium virens]|uniref:Ribonucleases P/MRP subunit Pop8-like domain-containing protein n=1 Tax=Viridothelium virens TaxID=1048519 RepID=A0A6A6H213_VIRVR|nr:hypothetical protein EV356DRAFT_534909 [Viridothelium virens]